MKTRNSKFYKFNPIWSGMLGGTGFIAVWWTLGLALPLITFIFGILFGVALRNQAETDNEILEGIQEAFSWRGTLLNMTVYFVGSWLPLFNLPGAFVHYWVWPMVTVLGFGLGFAVYLIIHLGKQFGKSSNTVSV